LRRCCPRAPPGTPDITWLDQALRSLVHTLARTPHARLPDVLFEQLGVPHDAALTMASGLDATMAACILALYRSAVDVGREWAPDFHDVSPPGLTVVPSEDPFRSADSTRHAARRAQATVVDLP